MCDSSLDPSGGRDGEGTDMTGIARQALMEIHLGDYMTETILGDRDYMGGNLDYARKKWLSAMENLDQAYQAVGLQPPDTELWYSGLRDVGILDY